MAAFPRTESQIVALAQEMVTGLTANPAIYPTPPVSVSDLQSAIDNYIAARDGAVAQAAAALSATEDKDSKLETLTAAMKQDLRFAEMKVGIDNNDLLALIGWGARSSATALEPPNQPRTLEAVRQGEDWVFLDWKEPLGGGKPAAYKVQRRERPSGPWLDVATAIDSEITLTGQTRGKEYEYRVIAVNRAGEGPESNTVMAVL